MKRQILRIICFQWPEDTKLHSGTRCVIRLKVGKRENSVIKRTQKRLMIMAAICLLFLIVILASFLVSDFSFRHSLQMFAIWTLAVGFCAFHQLFFTDEPVDVCDLLWCADNNSLAGLNRFHKIGRL